MLFRAVEAKGAWVEQIIYKPSPDWYRITIGGGFPSFVVYLERENHVYFDIALETTIQLLEDEIDSRYHK